MNGEYSLKFPKILITSEKMEKLKSKKAAASSCYTKSESNGSSSQLILSSLPSLERKEQAFSSGAIENATQLNFLNQKSQRTPMPHQPGEKKKKLSYRKTEFPHKNLGKKRRCI